MKNYYIVAFDEIDIKGQTKYNAYVQKVSESYNIFSSHFARPLSYYDEDGNRLSAVKGAGNICPTKKRAVELANLWNKAFIENKTSYFNKFYPANYCYD